MSSEKSPTSSRTSSASHMVATRLLLSTFDPTELIKVYRLVFKIINNAPREIKFKSTFLSILVEKTNDLDLISTDTEMWIDIEPEHILRTFTRYAQIHYLSEMPMIIQKAAEIGMSSKKNFFLL